MVIRRIGVASAAKTVGVIYACIGVIVGIGVAIMATLVGAAGTMGPESGEQLPAWIAPVFGVGAIVVAPIFYGVIGVVLGAFVSAVYNLVAGITGGLIIEVD